jgi:hypothetical protein
MEYTIDQDTRINMDKAFMGTDSGDSFNEKFNRKFNEGLERDKKAGVVDAFGRGYGEFDTGKKFSDEGKLSMPTYSADIDVEPSKIFHRPDMKDNRLVEYLPESGAFGNIGMDYQELGLTNVTDFSMTTTGKGSIGGTDLMSVYGNNYEPWEKTIMRDPRLSAKFNDETNINQKMAQMEADRGGIYDLPIDHKMMEAERARNFAMEQQEKMRMANKNFRDEYYNELNKGRLQDRVLTNYDSSAGLSLQRQGQGQGQQLRPIMMTKKIQPTERENWQSSDQTGRMQQVQRGHQVQQMTSRQMDQSMQMDQQTTQSKSQKQVNRQKLESWGR